MIQQPIETSNGQPALLSHALDYAGRGWSVIPAIGKKSAGLWKPFQTRPPDKKTLRSLFARKDVTGLAVVLGRVSGGLAVRDFDQADAYLAWADVYPGDAAALPTVKTARGYHVYGRLDEETFANLGDGELRADSKHYVLLPPSIHPEGPVYLWTNPLPGKSVLLPPLPLSLTSYMQRKKTQQTQQPKQPIACVPQAAIDAIEATLPNGPGKRNRKVFDLARRLKGIPGLDTSPAMLRAIVTEWHRRALPVITTKEFGETWSDFQIAWLTVKNLHGTSLRAAFEAARRAPSQPIDDNPDLGILAAMCRNLSAGGSQRFYLSCRTVEELFKVGRMTAWRWLQSFQFYGILEPVEKGSKEGRQATVWLYTEKELNA
jgi:hypothetical protein